MLPLMLPNAPLRVVPLLRLSWSFLCVCVCVPVRVVVPVLSNAALVPLLVPPWFPLRGCCRMRRCRACCQEAAALLLLLLWRPVRVAAGGGDAQLCARKCDPVCPGLAECN